MSTEYFCGRRCKGDGWWATWGLSLAEVLQSHKPTPPPPPPDYLRCTFCGGTYVRNTDSNDRMCYSCHSRETGDEI